ncbi:unnamed protein product [Effrenium voratum]|nr:unnamed protein product [Effrenium voratum]
MEASKLDQALDRLRKSTDDAAWTGLRAVLQQGSSEEELRKVAELLRKDQPIPEDVAALCVRNIQTLLADSSASAAEAHSVFQMLHRCLQHAAGDAELVQLLAERLRRCKALQSCTQILLCLQRLSEQQPQVVKDSPAVAAAITPALQVLSDSVLRQRSSRGVLREASAMLTALPALLEANLEAAALTTLACLQPLAVLGAPYVLPGRVLPPPGLSVPSDCSWSETDAAEGRSKGKGRDGKDGASAVAMLQLQCRSLALRSFAQLFKLWPKAFFGRWSLVLDFQSGEVSRPCGQPLPMLLSICQQDPAPKVRQAGLVALLALLQAPQLRNWPVPLERVSGSAAGNTSLTGQLATTIRQSHALVLQLLRSPADLTSALRACAELAGCTPYPKLQSGLLSELLAHLLGFALDRSLEASNAPAAGNAVTAILAVLKREDCRAELSAFLFAEQASPLPADALLQQMLHLLSLPRPETEVAPSGQRKSRSKEEADDPLIIQELALVTGRLPTFLPPSPPESTLQLMQQLVLALAGPGRSSVLRLRAFRLLSDLAPSSFSASFRQRVLQLAAAEANSSVKAAALAALPGLVTSCEPASQCALCAGALQALQPALSDSSGPVRTAAAQALGALTSVLEEPSSIVKMLLPLARDAAGDVRSAAATALSSFTEPLQDFHLRQEVLATLLPLCSDASDKARASALRAVGCVAELGPLEDVPGLVQALKPALARPPPKCQWNACRSAGQLAKSTGDLQPVLELLSPLCTLLSVENLKVRIQAAQALQQFAQVTQDSGEPSIKIARCRLQLRPIM